MVINNGVFSMEQNKLVDGGIIKWLVVFNNGAYGVEQAGNCVRGGGTIRWLVVINNGVVVWSATSW